MLTDTDLVENTENSALPLKKIQKKLCADILSSNLPKDVNMTFQVSDTNGKIKTMSSMEILFDMRYEPLLTDSQLKTTKNDLTQHTIEDYFTHHKQCFDAANILFKNGATLPAPDRAKRKSETTAHYFSYLSGSRLAYHPGKTYVDPRSPKDLFIALHQNPDIIKEKDENGKTLLDHALIACNTLKSDSNKLRLTLISETLGTNSNETTLPTLIDEKNFRALVSKLRDVDAYKLMMFDKNKPTIAKDFITEQNNFSTLLSSLSETDKQKFFDLMSSQQNNKPTPISETIELEPDELEPENKHSTRK